MSNHYDRKTTHWKGTLQIDEENISLKKIRPLGVITRKKSTNGLCLHDKPVSV